jgi:hypothetical protein
MPRPERFGDHVRVGSDFNATTNPAEVTTIEFDAYVDGHLSKLAIVVERLASKKLIIAELVDLSEEVPYPRDRIGEWEVGL